jgi:hypothetical protein
VDRTVLWQSALLQALGVADVSLVLALLLGHSFFETWGWLVGPGAWAACSIVTARVLRLPRGRALLGALVAGLPSVVAVVIGIHWLGAVVAIALYAAWCARLGQVRIVKARAAVV